MRIGISRGWLAGTVLTSVAVLVGCSSGGGQSTDSSAAAGTGPIPVVTSTNVWGDIVSQIGGEQVNVTALISDPAADPHSFEPNAQAQLALSKAALVVENGGGYDDFVQTMLASAGTTAPVITMTASSTNTSGTTCPPSIGWRAPWPANSPRSGRTRRTISGPTWQRSR